MEQATGKVAWKADRNYTCGRESAQSYTTPLLIREGNRSTIVVWGADHLTGHDAATGKMIWSYGGFNPDRRPAWRTIASPVIYRDVILVPYGRGRYLAAMRYEEPLLYRGAIIISVKEKFSGMSSFRY